MPQLALFAPLLIMVAALALLAGLARLVLWERRRRRRVPPFTRPVERFPGHTLLTRLEALTEEIAIQVTTLLVMPVYLYASYISYLYFGARPLTWVGLAGLTVISGAFAVFGLVKTHRLLHQRRSLRLGYEGEVEVGQQLNRLMQAGWHVFHDFPADGFNIDHVVVNPGGVFAVETKARSKPLKDDGRKQAVVEYDGRTLRFPDGRDQEMIAQAQRQAEWLSDWLSAAVGEPVAARAILALPGWFVKRTSSEGLPAVNPGQFDSLFRFITPRSLTAEQTARIVHQLERKCRDVGTCTVEAP
jgi:hypothetical protein